MVVVGDVDTHKDVHTHLATALGATGALLISAEFPADARGHKELLGWMSSFGDVGSA